MRPAKSSSKGGLPPGDPPPLTRVLKEARPSLALPLFSKHLDHLTVFLPRSPFMNIVIKRGDVSKVLARDTSAKSTF